MSEFSATIGYLLCVGTHSLRLPARFVCNSFTSALYINQNLAKIPSVLYTQPECSPNTAYRFLNGV